MGRVTVRGRSTPLQVFEALPGFDPGEAHRLAEAIAAFDRAEAGALERLREMAAERPDDVALAILVGRLERVAAGGSYALD